MSADDAEDNSQVDARPETRSSMSTEEREKLRGEQGTSSGDPHDDTDTDSGA
jgi:hypothetical protein